jgi:hypothetical protein
MATVRSGTGVLSVLNESSYLTKDGSFEANKKQVNLWDITTNLKHQSLENQAARTVDLGKHMDGFGLAHPDSNFTFSTYCFGLGTEAGDGDTPVANFMSNLIGSCIGCAPVLTDGDTVKAASVPTTTTVPQTTAANLAAGKFLAHKTGGRTYVRPILSYAGDVATLGLALPTAPAPGDVLNGQISFLQSEEPMNRVIQGDILKRNTLTSADSGQMYEFFGSVGNFTLDEVGVAEAQTLSFDYKVGAFTRYNPKTRIAPVSKRPTVAAGGEFYLAKFGNTAGLPLKFLNVSLNLNRTYTPDPNVNSDEGIAGWVLTDQDTEIGVTVHDNQAMPTGFTASNFSESFELGDNENLYHMLWVFGNKAPGKLLAFYFPCIQLTGEPEDADQGGLQAYKLKFSLTAGLPSSGVLNKIWIAQI